MVRDKHRDQDHFLSYIKTKTKSHEDRIKKLELGHIRNDRILPVKQSMVTNLIQKVVAMYSLGIPVEKIPEDFETIVDLIEESWARGQKKLTGPKNIVLDQYEIDAHTHILRILSVGILLRLQNEFFQRLGNVIRTDNVIDLVFEFVLASKLDSWEVRQEKDTYAFKLYQNLKKAIGQSENNEAEKFVKIFLEKDWLKEQRRAQMLTESNKDWYYGYWSFESAAIVAILDLDDSSFRDNQYYPKDLVDYYRSTKKDKIG